MKVRTNLSPEELEKLGKALIVTADVIKAEAGVRGPVTESTVKPQGPPQAPKAAAVPSMPGLPAPGNVAGPGKPPSMGSSPGGSGGMQYAACPFGGGADCIQHGGNGAAQHKANGSIMKKHQEAMAAGAQPKTEFAKEQQRKQLEAAAKTYNLGKNPHREVVDHLAEGEIGAMRSLSGPEAGANKSFKISIVGNGSGLMKPKVDFGAYVATAYGLSDEDLKMHSQDELNAMADKLCAPGAGTMPDGMNPMSESGAHQMSRLLGLRVPVTTLRHHDGADEGPVGVTSVQQWQDNAVSLRSFSKGGKGYYLDTIKAAPEDQQDKLHEQFSETAVADIIWNNGDRHFGNLMVNPDTNDLIPIDHGTAFGNGLSGHRNEIAFNMHASGVALQIPPTMQNKLKGQTLDSTMRALEESGLPDWSKGQTYLRTKYALYLQETFDHIPMERIRGTVTSRNGEVVPQADQWREGNESGNAAFVRFFSAQTKQELPHQQFESWAKSWMEEGAKDENNLEAKRLLQMNPLRDSAQVLKKQEATPEALAKHLSSIKPYDFDKDKMSASRIKAEAPKGRSFRDAVSARSAPEMPTGSISSTPSGTAVEKKKPKKDKTIELNPDDLQELKPLSLDLDEFEDSKKSLFIKNLNASFPFDKS